VKNVEVQNIPDDVAERTIQRYFEIVEDIEDKRGDTKVTELEKPMYYEPISKKITSDNLT
jgi:hypothetical protein